MRILSLLIAMTLSACFAEDVPPAEPQPTAPQGPGPTTASSATATDERLVVYDRSVTAGNPLKGFLTNYQWSVPDDRLPHGLEFLYLPISAVLEGPQTYAFESGFEPHLEESKARGNHLIIRFYLDYPGSESGLPQWLLSQINCTEYTDYGGGCSPDYNDPLLQSTVLDFIAALGARYDGDNRVGFIQIGLLGFWGEWHTYPQSDLFASNTFQQQVIAAFDQAFDQTHVVLRYPVHDSPDRAIGYHDDSFAYATLGEIDWFFYPKLLAAQADQRWQHVPIGGEVYPDLQASLFSSDYVVDTYSQDFAQCAEQTHISWMINNAAFATDDGYQDSQLEGAQAASIAMGYEFFVPRFALTASGLKGGKIDIELSVEISNTGVAPFYYPLALQLSDAVDEPRILASNLQTLQPGETRILSVSLEDVAPELLSRTYSLSLSSSILLGDQVIQFADASNDEGVLDLTANFGCDVEGTRLKVGERLDDCFCDVDGQLVGGSGGACE
ncbi:MAG: DUF4832 domain-containing protein [Myxococcota bacterium]|nr:DUF4832 domain-containing protein [Myxococcota bacterium]